MNKLAILVAMTVVFAFAAFGQQTGGSVTGTVSFGGDKSVLHNASVQIVELKKTVVTDDAGTYQFTNIPAGKYTLRAHLEGFGDETRSVTVTAGAPATADFTLNIASVNEQVTVTATGSEVSAFESIASVESIDSSQITARAAVGLGDVLQDEAGVAKRSAGPGNSRPVIRGFDGDRVKVAADGVGVGSLASQSGDHAEPVDTLAVERIEVVKGPATLLYGSNAIGGVVNAISGHDEGAHPGLRGYFSAVGGINGAQASSSAGVEYGVGPWMFWGNASGQRSSDYKAGGDFGTVHNTFTRSASGALGGGYFGQHAFFTTNYNYYQSRYGIPIDFNEEEPEMRSLRVWRNDVKFNFGYNDLGWAVNNVKFTVDLSNYRHQEMSDNSVDTTYRNKVDSIRGMFEQKPWGKLSGRFGFEGFRRDFSTVGQETLIDGPVRQNSFSVFGLEEVKFERATLQFGGRVENNSYNPSNPGLLDRDFTGFSGAVGARFDTWKGGAFVANYSHGYRAPAMEELYNHGPHDGSLLFEAGNPLLKPEISDGLDLSLRHQNKRIKAEANFYYYKFKNFVFLAPTGQFDEDSGFEIANYLQENSRFTGTELSLDVTANKYLNVLTGLDYVNAQLETGQPLPRIPPLRGRIGLDFHYSDFSVTPEFVAVADQDRVFTNETRTPGYGVFNVGATYVISKKHYANIFSVNAFNLTNRLYYNH
ncbi:MAG TPA: TonB-dependent receptor, partial [Pyrinomonadaceae bacterium]|nr:TonB-dependent receptor [Pyrinomonadaceae bacterium]